MGQEEKVAHVPDDPSKSYAQSLADFLATRAPTTEATVVPIETASKKRGRPRKIISTEEGNQLIVAVRAYMRGRAGADGNYLDPPIECIAPTGAFKSWAIDNQRARTKTKAQMVRQMLLHEWIPEGVSRERELIIGAFEFIAEQEYRSAWGDLNHKINTYTPWPPGYDPYKKLIYAIGAQKNRTDNELFLDNHCMLRHFFMQIKRVVAGVSTKDDYPITLIGHGPSMSGKSTLFKMIFQTIFGDWFKLDNFRLLTDEFRQKRAAALPIIMMDEMEKAAHVSQEQFKNFISSSTLMCRGIFTDEINDDDNIASIACLTNLDPPFGLFDESEGIARRVAAFECHHQKYSERSAEVDSFTPEDALALVTGLEITDHVIWTERASSLHQRQQIMRAPSFYADWLEHTCYKHAQPYEQLARSEQQKRRHPISEIVKSMAEFKRTMGRKVRLSSRPRTVAMELKKAGATVKQTKNEYYLVSHSERNAQYVDEGELKDLE